MAIGDSFLPEFDQEMATTRRVLERVPSEKAQWKPHPKSFALGHLAQLLAWMPGWITTTLRETELNLMGGAGYSFGPTEASDSSTLAASSSSMRVSSLIYMKSTCIPASATRPTSSG